MARRDVHAVHCRVLVSSKPTPQDTALSMAPTTLVALWDDGVHAVHGALRRHELAGRAVRGRARDPNGRALALVDGVSLCRRAATGEWAVLAKSDAPLACVVAVGATIYVGTDDARVLQLSDAGELEPLGSFDAVPGRASWFAGGARSMVCGWARRSACAA
jgi:hypothetical protein